jgi:hypothetical protein
MADIETFLDEAERIHGTCDEDDLARLLREAPPELVTPHRRQPHDAPLESRGRLARLPGVRLWWRSSGDLE